MVLMEVSGVFSSNAHSSYPQVVLKEAEGDSYLHIVIGRFEAAAISMAHGKQQPARPISYDLAHQILVGVDARVSRVDITDLHESTYYAEVHLVNGDDGKTHVLDARPSDAIALALRFDAPIYATTEIIQQAGHAGPGDEQRVPSDPESKLEAAIEPDLEFEAESVAVSQEELSIVAAPVIDHLEQLKRRMRQAIAEEAYEEAARLRDEISRLEREKDSI
jgi:hypothetical protein